MTQDDGRQWNVQEGPDGPVEALVTFAYVENWLQAQEGPHGGAQSLLIAWCREHPQYVHDMDPRGRVAFSSSTPVHLDGGGFATVTTEERVQRDGERKGSVRITRLPHRALSRREARDLAQQVLRLTEGEQE